MVLISTDHWEGTEVVITEKMDGECTTLTGEYMHARSPDYNAHPSRTRVRAEWGRIRGDIPVNWKICLENVSAVHSIKYTELSSYFLVFSIWEKEVAFSWDETTLYSKLLGLDSVPVLWRGIWDKAKCHEITERLDLTKHEGVVIRPAGTFEWKFIDNPWWSPLGKWVRRGHVTTDEHWMDKPVVWNKLKGE